jgi:hypothetical protein
MRPVNGTVVRRTSEFPFWGFICPLAIMCMVSMPLTALVQIGSAIRLELSEQTELMTRDEQAEESGGVVRWTPF